MRLFLASPSLFPKFFFKTYRTRYFRKQQNETGYFCGMITHLLWYPRFSDGIATEKEMRKNINGLLVGKMNGTLF